MVTPALCAPSEIGSRRYSRPGPPYSFTYPDRRFHLSSQDNRAIIMTDRDESDQPRKRIAVACGRCRKRKIRCSGDPGNGGPCSNCKNAGHEPCLFLRVSSQETHMKDGGDYTYNLEAARTYAHQTRGAVSPLSSMPQYTHEMTTSDGLAPYRQSSYPYSGKGYHPTMSGWTSTYPDDGSVDYSLSYSSYPLMNQEPPLVSGYSQHYNTRKPDYVETETPSYSYNNLVHRPAVTNEGFSLSSIAASLPNTSERLLSSDRLHSSVNKTLTSPSSYRDTGISAYSYTNKASTSTALPDVPYAPFVGSGIYTSSTSPHRPADGPYPPVASSSAGSEQQLYTQPSPSLRATEDGSAGLSYVLCDSKLDTSRRDSHSSGSASTLFYVPPSFMAEAVAGAQEGQRVGSSHTNSKTGVSSSTSRASRDSGSSSSSSASGRASDGHRRSAGSLRGV